ncbi:MAG TPA: hypothetical protein VLE72_02045 [Candidatus Saccharimonadales bacterium]|nr:hypothetical protein [Candidatus Saccharimonadales bacterium]
MDKKLVLLGAFAGSTIGGYLPMLFGSSALSGWSIITGAIGGLFGIWLVWQLAS